MKVVHSDALVFFGATGDLAYKKIFPSLQAMLKRGNLNVPVIGVAKAGWNLDQLKAREGQFGKTRRSGSGGVLKNWSGLLRYVDGDYNDPATFQAIKKELGSAKQPAHYLLPFHRRCLERWWKKASAKAGCAGKGARVIVEKPFGRDQYSARELNEILLQTFDDEPYFPH